MPRIAVTSVFVSDQIKARDFYTQVLGFQLKYDTEIGQGARWTTVVSADDPDGTELLLEPDAHPIAAAYNQGLHAAGIPAIQLSVPDLDAEHRRLVEAGVQFTMEPTTVSGVRMAIIDDTVGNLLQIVQTPALPPTP